MIIVERATEDDYSEIVAIDEAVVGDDHRKVTITKAIINREVIVARIGAERVGFGIINRSFFEHYFVALLVVHPDHRRQGIAMEIMRYIEKTCPETKLFTSTNESNTIARLFLARLHYIQSGEINNLDDGDPEIIYVKFLER